MAILEAIDRDLDERGLEDKRGRPRYLLNHRWRVSRQLDHWLGKISDAIARQSTAGDEPPRAELADYVRELERIALGRDPSASARDRLAALKELVKLDAAAASAAGPVIVNVNPLAVPPARGIIESEDSRSGKDSPKQAHLPADQGAAPLPEVLRQAYPASFGAELRIVDHNLRCLRQQRRSS